MIFQLLVFPNLNLIKSLLIRSKLKLNYRERIDNFKSKNRFSYYHNEKLFVIKVKNGVDFTNEIVKSLGKSTKESFIVFTINEDLENWDYKIYRNNKKVDKFSVNPYPNLNYDIQNEFYFDGVDMSKKLNEWVGKPDEIIALFPNITLESIKRYYEVSYTDWEECYDEELRVYPNDDYCVGDCRQFFDFARKLGLSKEVFL